jgi:dihydrofolate reductase
MRKIFMFNRMSLDGAYASADGNMDWFVQDPEVDMAIHGLMKPDTALFGRNTFQLFEAVWPPMADNPHAPEGAKMMAKELNEMHKIVFSSTLKKVDWVNSRVAEQDLVSEVTELKKGDGGDVVIFGSGTVVAQLSQARLIDEYLIALTPVTLGTGKALFKDVEGLGLELVEARTFDSGNVLLHHRAAQ